MSSSISATLRAASSVANCCFAASGITLPSGLAPLGISRQAATPPSAAGLRVASSSASTETPVTGWVGISSARRPIDSSNCSIT